MNDETKKNSPELNPGYLIMVVFLFAIIIIPIGVLFNATTRMWAAEREASHLKNVLAEVAPGLKAAIAHRLRGTQKWVTVEGEISGKPFSVQCVCRDVTASPLKWEASPPSGDWHADRLAEEYMATDPQIEGATRSYLAPSHEDRKPGVTWMSGEELDEQWAHNWRAVK